METSTSTAEPTAGRDGGMVLVLTLLLTIVLAVIVLALATYAATALRTSRVTDGRNESNVNASAGLDWTIERLAEKQLAPADCDGSDVGVPVAVLPQAGTIAVACTNVAEVNGNPTVHLVATATLPDGTFRRIDALVQVPAASHVANVTQWSTDAPLSPAAASATTTAAPAGTTTTTAALAGTTTTTAAPAGTTTTTAPVATTTTTTAPTTTTTTVTPSGTVTCQLRITSQSGANYWAKLDIVNGRSTAISAWDVRIELGPGTSVDSAYNWDGGTPTPDKDGVITNSDLGWNGTVAASTTRADVSGGQFKWKGNDRTVPTCTVTSFS
ncbi:hypothetical protein BDK89_1030 [Ilumatobacter fluminis]|uniref:Cellulose binding domain-containing protein n=1 Tax=Ilumatobacter fluminis TaxID=467091 RepID=A0A4R7HY79_9ACTN|nr:hypothetical protein [Ilumatobacter fluminis]TDT15459.1 hypothetical protein BDK89_1030 [Ilumatobacter fluminis]